ncbi:hypothetical protein VTI74DRAFT_10038 [Chaetomium olivicolor]
MFTQPLLFLAAALPFTSGAPTPSSTTTVSKTDSSPRITHTVVAGRPGLRFDPDNIVAVTGSIIEFHFLPANHSVVEASFSSPCQPKDTASFYSGFFPVSKGADGSVQQSGEVFQIEVKDDRVPIWFYCAQDKGRHCQSGMVGVVNQRVDSGKTLEVFREAAKKVEVLAGVQKEVQGGWRGVNPNPLGGF